MTPEKRSPAQRANANDRVDNCSLSDAEFSTSAPSLEGNAQGLIGVWRRLCARAFRVLINLASIGGRLA